MEKLLQTSAALFVLGVFLIPLVVGQITFTGNAATDFSLAHMTPTIAKSYLKINKTTLPVGTFNMRQKSRVTGMAIRNVHFQYDYQTDTLYTGVECLGICGDADGDGDAGTSTDQQVIDNPNYCSTEQLSIMIWPEPPASWVPDPNQFNYFFPTVVIGVKQLDCLDRFGAYLFARRIDITTGDDVCPFTLPISSCMTDVMRLSSNPGTSGSPSAPGYSASLPLLSDNLPGKFKPIPAIELFSSPDVSTPHIEFKQVNFSHYPGFTFTPGLADIVFGMSVLSSLAGTSIGASQVYPDKFSVRCAIEDGCGVCGGDNSTCGDCLRIAYGTHKYDECGVCNGGNSAKDPCGVCFGNGQTCADCTGEPNGQAKYDDCGVCDGQNSEKDVCNVCFGDGKSCLDCDEVPFGTNVPDECGHCGGDSTSCQDCFGVPNGPARYDYCGICGGNNGTCTDCEGVVDGPARYHPVWGICSWDGLAGCDGNPWSGLQYDSCGVCGGDDSDCTCSRYVGYTIYELDWLLYRWSIVASLVKINETLELLKEIKGEWEDYKWDINDVEINDYIEYLGSFCDDCLDSFDYANTWLADVLAGNSLEEGVDREHLEWDI